MKPRLEMDLWGSYQHWAAGRDEFNLFLLPLPYQVLGPVKRKSSLLSEISRLGLEATADCIIDFFHLECDKCSQLDGRMPKKRPCWPRPKRQRSERPSLKLPSCPHYPEKQTSEWIGSRGQKGGSVPKQEETSFIKSVFPSAVSGEWSDYRGGEKVVLATIFMRLKINKMKQNPSNFLCFRCFKLLGAVSPGAHHCD